MGLPAGCVNKGLKYAALALSGACLSLHLISGSRMMAMAAPSTHPKQKWQLSLLKLEFLGPEKLGHNCRKTGPENQESSILDLVFM